MRNPILLAFLALGAAIAAGKAETKVAIQDLPEAVRKAVAEQTRNATILGISREVEGGKTFYEVESKVNGKGRDVLIDAAGAVVELEEEIELAAVPAAARAALAKLSAGGKITRVEALTKAGKTTYEAAIARKGKTTEVVVTAEGSRVREP